MPFKARFEVTSLDETLAKVQTAVLLADSDLIVSNFDLRISWLNKLSSLKTVKSTGSLILCACINVKSGDKAFSIVNSTVLLANLARARDHNSSSIDIFKAVKGA